MSEGVLVPLAIFSPVWLFAGWLATGYVVFEVLERDEDKTENWLLLWLWPITWLLAFPMVIVAVVILVGKGLKYLGRYVINVGSLYKDVIKR